MATTQSTRVRVRYAETDQMGVAHHSTWPLYWEIGRTDLLRARAKSYADLEREDGILFPVIDYGVAILAPLRYDDEIEIRTRLANLGRVKLRFEYEGWVGATLIARGHTVHGVLNREWRTIRLPEDIARRLAGE